MDTTITASLTHPETAWLIHTVPIGITVTALLLLVGALHRQLAERLLEHQHARYRKLRRRLPPALIPDTALLWTPTIISPIRFIIICVTALLILAAILSLLAPIFLLLLVTGPATAIIIWLLLWYSERRYISALDTALTAAVGRLGASLRSGASFSIALEKVLQDMPTGPLRAEWAWAQQALGQPLGGGGLATAHQVVAALAVQTPSRRHATLLGHLTIALTQTQDVQVRRVAAAYQALQESEQRRSEAATELAQMRYSGIAIGGAGLFMAGYLALTQWERTLLAYGTPLGLIVGMVVGVALVMPIIGGMLLSQAEDLDY